MALGAHEYIPRYYRYTCSYSPFDGAASYDRIPGRERPFVFTITSRDFLCGFGDGVLRGNLCGLRVAGGGHGDLVGMLQSFSPSGRHSATRRAHDQQVLVLPPPSGVPYLAVCLPVPDQFFFPVLLNQFVSLTLGAP